MILTGICTMELRYVILGDLASMYCVSESDLIRWIERMPDSIPSSWPSRKTLPESIMHDYFRCLWVNCLRNQHLKTYISNRRLALNRNGRWWFRLLYAVWSSGTSVSSHLASVYVCHLVVAFSLNSFFPSVYSRQTLWISLLLMCFESASMIPMSVCPSSNADCSTDKLCDHGHPPHPFTMWTNFCSFDDWIGAKSFPYLRWQNQPNTNS
jgi:hypothetical protein